MIYLILLATYTFTLGVGLERISRERFVYDPAMNDTNSVAFRRYAHPIKEALDRTLMQSDLRDVYRGVNIVKFTPKPSKVLFDVQLSSNTEENKLKDVLRKYLITSNFSLGGMEVFASKDLGLVIIVFFIFIRIKFKLFFFFTAILLARYYSTRSLFFACKIFLIGINYML